MRRRLRAAVTLSQLSSAACDPRPQAGAGRCNSPVSGGAPPAPRPRHDPRRAGVRLLQTRRVLNHGRHRPVGGARRRVDTVWVVITGGGLRMEPFGARAAGHPTALRTPSDQAGASHASLGPGGAGGSPRPEAAPGAARRASLGSGFSPAPAPPAPRAPGLLLGDGQERGSRTPGGRAPSAALPPRPGERVPFPGSRPRRACVGSASGRVRACSPRAGGPPRRLR